MAIVARETKLNSSTFQLAILVQIGQYVVWTGLLLLASMFVVSIVTGSIPGIVIALSDEYRGRSFRGGRYSAGAPLFGVWLLMLIGLIKWRRQIDATVVLSRAKKLESLRAERGNKSERRAAGKIAADYAIPETMPIYSKRLRERAGCPTLIRLSTETGKWVVRRTSDGWIYVDASRGAP